MIPTTIEEQAEELRRLCLHYGVRRLDLFGSAATGRYDSGKSDLDFLVEFQPSAFDAYADAYFGLLEALEQLFGQPVDLVVESAIKNPYFLESVEQTRTPVYAAIPTIYQNPLKQRGSGFCFRKLSFRFQAGISRISGTFPINQYSPCSCGMVN